jgi:hypothetical protein
VLGLQYHVNVRGFVIRRDVGVIRRASSVAYTAIEMSMTVVTYQA